MSSRVHRKWEGRTVCVTRHRRCVLEKRGGAAKRWVVIPCACDARCGVGCSEHIRRIIIIINTVTVIITVTVLITVIVTVIVVDIVTVIIVIVLVVTVVDVAIIVAATFVIVVANGCDDWQ